MVMPAYPSRPEAGNGDARLAKSAGWVFARPRALRIRLRLWLN
jgi:hypothetical protein